MKCGVGNGLPCRHDQPEDTRELMRKRIAELEADLALSREAHAITSRERTSANSAYQRIFDEKVERCAYIKDLEACNNVQRDYIKRLEKKAYPKIEMNQEIDCSPKQTFGPSAINPIDLPATCEWHRGEDGLWHTACDRTFMITGTNGICECGSCMKIKEIPDGL
jgi:hypothetical protein